VVNTSQDDYSAPNLDTPQAPISSKTPTIEEVVLLIHGIRDFAEWQDMVATVLSAIPNIEVCPLKYGRFDAFRFWFPLWTREAPVKNLLWRIRSAHDRFSPANMSVVAHSFGTYAIGKILRENPDIRLHRLILCGAILRSNFRWDQIQRSVETPIINDCGIKDIWPVLAQSTTFGYGPSGRFGFGTPGVRDRYHDFGHGGFFQEKFVSDFWLPWFRNGNFIKSKAPPPSGTRWHLLSIIQLKWLALLCFAFIAAAYLHNPKQMLEAPVIFRAFWTPPRPPASAPRVIEAYRRMSALLASLEHYNSNTTPAGEPWTPKLMVYFKPYFEIASYLREHPGDIDGAYEVIWQNGGPSRTFIDDTQDYEAVVIGFFQEYKEAKSSQ
jgi:hypothetical protein